LVQAAATRERARRAERSVIIPIVIFNFPSFSP
jgi:hypothetical protein